MWHRFIPSSVIQLLVNTWKAERVRSRSAKLAHQYETKHEDPVGLLTNYGRPAAVAFIYYVTQVRHLWEYLELLLRLQTAVRSRWRLHWRKGLFNVLIRNLVPIHFMPTGTPIRWYYGRSLWLYCDTIVALPTRHYGRRSDDAIRCGNKYYFFNIL